MKAITICQPWAQAIIGGAKRVENRSWPTRFRGLLAIHAGKSRRWLKDMGAPHVRRACRGQELSFGAIIGVVEVIDCVRIADWLAEHPRDPWAVGPWCHVYANPRAIEPVPCGGLLSLWSVPESIARRVQVPA